MANIKISEMEESTQVISDDYIPIVQQGVNKKVKASLIKTEILKLVFPIGSTYTTQTNTNPSTILNFGTWERVKGKVLVGLDEDDTDFNTIGKTGGEKTHKLTVDEIPSHNHSLPIANGETSGTYFEYQFDASKRWYSGNDIMGSAGGDQPHNNLQPYQVVGYMWIRTA